MSATLLGRWERTSCKAVSSWACRPFPAAASPPASSPGIPKTCSRPKTKSTFINEHVKEATAEGTYMSARVLLVRGYYRFTRTRHSSPIPSIPSGARRHHRPRALGGQLILDRLDNPFDPRRGFYTGLDSAGRAKPSAPTQEHSDSSHRLLALEPRRGWTWFRACGSAPPAPQRRARPPAPDFLPRPRIDPRLQARLRWSRRGHRRPAFYAGGGALFVLNESFDPGGEEPARRGVCGRRSGLGNLVGCRVFPAVGAGIGLRWGTPVGPCGPTSPGRSPTGAPTPERAFHSASAARSE